jgi:hypothetical protein
MYTSHFNYQNTQIIRAYNKRKTAKLSDSFLSYIYCYQPAPVVDGGIKLDVEELSARLFDNGDICSLSGDGVVR